MGFWIFMLVMELLVPLTMIVLGNIFFRKAPKVINSVYGYRTSMSMKNQETWKFAHNYCGKIWRVIGWIVFVIALVVMMTVFGKSEDEVGGIGTYLIIFQTVCLIIPIFPTERALRKNFDKDGKRKHELS